MSFEKNLDKYAKLAIKVGVNIQEGQTLLVRSPIECAPFVRKVVKHAYEAGAKNVHIEWSDEECTLLNYCLLHIYLILHLLYHRHFLYKFCKQSL